ncbi:hypothetical protein EST38_g5481 [Candolleomyces aberdarensis]|uniref:Uncharacterized protein n=1 Tax=Candolleomyces aberdarensis TaxID=2316362 RepID=A0A4Q2DKD2_9AGAR|nr:hypothetical protein EST38_g5481 [Candolleomyces aberdarensis]
MSYQERLATLEGRLKKLARKYEQDEDAETEEYRKALLKLMQEVVTVVDEAHQQSADDLEDVVKEAESVLNEGVEFAYNGGPNNGFGGASLYEDGMDSFAHSDARPLLEIARDRKLTMSPFAIEGFLRIMQSFMPKTGKDGKPFELPDALKPKGPWKDTSHLHPSSSLCARFLDGVPLTATTSLTLESTPRALAVYEARAEVASDEICSPAGRMSISSCGKFLVAPMAGGYKNRTPHLGYFFFDDEHQSKDRFRGSYPTLGLSDIAHACVVDDRTKLVFVGDGDRVKSYRWWDERENEVQEDIIGVHTLNTFSYSGAMGILPNGRIGRSGKGKIAIWNIDQLPTHQDPEGGAGAKRKRGKKAKGKGRSSGFIGEEMDEESLDSWRDDPEDIERSSGSEPHSVITLPADWAQHKIAIWEPAPHSATALGSILAAIDSTQEKEAHQFCHLLDLEKNGQIVTRYLGHAGVINAITTSRGDPNRIPTDTPHLPVIFTSNEREEAIRMWDVRARAPIYDLATGNNDVLALAWNDDRNELYAVTECRYVDRLGYHHEYRRAKIPKEKTEDDDEGDEERDTDEDGDDYDDEDDWDDEERAWPQQAFHSETYFGHVFDAGEHRIYRYSFKTEPDTSIVPDYGNATIGEPNYW